MQLRGIERANAAHYRARRRRRGRSAGFTLIEMLVVITIIGLIAGIVGPRVLSYLGESKVKAARIQIDSFSSALDLFYLDVGRYPTTDESLQVLVQRPGNAAAWNGPYVNGGVIPKDPWGNLYVYRSPAEQAPFEVLSRGSDGIEGGTGTAADITGRQK